VVHDSGRIEYREVVRTVVDTEAPIDRVEVYADAFTGDVVARRSLLMHASATIRYNAPVRGPQETRLNYVAPGLNVTIGGDVFVTDSDGVVTYPGAAAQKTLGVSGPLVDVSNASGPVASNTLLAADGDTAVWNAAEDEQVDAQLAAYVHSHIVKEYVRNIAPDFGFLDEQLPVTVNIDDTCNAFSDGFSINFFLSSPSCENTGLLSDVVYHEFGHSSHSQSVIPGVGFFNTALSEGISDYLSATITGDPGIGRGFFYDESPLRQIDPDGFEYRWPEDRGQVHGEGRIIGGALWDLRKLLIDKLGEATGVAKTDEIWFEATRRASNIPTMYVEALLVDDDDGNLANGTPNACEINEAFGPHGLFQAGPGAERVLVREGGGGLEVQLQLDIPSFPDCPVSASPSLLWRLRDQPAVVEEQIMGTDGEGGWFGFFDAVDSEVVQYRILTNYSTGTERSLPDNFVDPWYEAYFGDVEPLYCFSNDPGLSAWNFEGQGDDWTAGGPLMADANDPGAPFDNDGTHISQEGEYSPGANTVARMTVQTQGYPEVRLQYQRWLTVEDGFFDRASIYANGTRVWGNFASETDETATFHHTDREWRFHDVDLSQEVVDDVVELEFELQSDGGLEFGGWTIDGLCVVGVGTPTTCGDGVLDSGEQCDDGNRRDGDGCNSSCVLEDDSGDTDGGFPPMDPTGTGGGFPPDTDGDPGAIDGGSNLLGRGCACTSGTGTGGLPFGPLLLGVVMAGLRRRRQ
jgi:MYXO-CTERM domain-containing protein